MQYSQNNYVDDQYLHDQHELRDFVGGDGDSAEHDDDDLAAAVAVVVAAAVDDCTCCVLHPS